MDEEWRTIPGYEGYEVSDLGRVRSIDRLDARGRRRKGAMLSQALQKSGHLTVSISGGGSRRTVGTHVVVLEAFVGPRPEGMDACHWNDVPADNRLSNLRWDTRSANVRDSVRNGNHPMANRTHCPKGHPYTDENTYRYPGGNRACNECRRIYREENAERRRAWNREYMRKKRAARSARRTRLKEDA